MILEDDPDLRSIIGKSNRDRVLQYDWKNITNKWVKIIEEVYGRVKNK
jgi:glycosyltransferase involved in cell wall biosynthesis